MFHNNLQTERILLMWTQEQLECFERAVKDLEGLVETLEELVGNLEERLKMADERLYGATRGPEGSCR